ncbi:hypothetical protein AVEN_178436-1 [Araneus ventricosus]|uniref:HTH CENPB-type domain-containing protein n=1 Tax=Araneus ventricosus TaxID=182803 RepID=A0A4Y2JH96_ARAVE|nr:hypothetical protein AVEN_178436-1 [Araneus ventricosus]
MPDHEIRRYLDPYYKPKLKILQKTDFHADTDFHASNRWLESFRKRHGISFKAICGEAGDASDETVNTWIKKIEKLIEGYEPQNIVNADESGIFFVAYQQNLYVKKANCTGEVPIDNVNDIIRRHMNNYSSDDDECNINEDISDEELSIKSYGSFLDTVSELEKFALSQGDAEMLELLKNTTILME